MALAGSTVYVSDRVCVRTGGTQRVISVRGVVFAHYELADRVAEAYSMIMLCESGYATRRVLGSRTAKSGGETKAFFI